MKQIYFAQSQKLLFYLLYGEHFTMLSVKEVKMKAVILCILTVFLGLWGCFAETTIANKSLGSREPNPARLTISGSKLITPSGQAIQLRGFNWGHWGKAQPQDAADNYAQGANVVRIILRWWGLYGSPEINSRDDKSPGHIDPEHLAMLDSYIKWATDAGLWVVLAVDSDCGQNGLQDSSNQKFCDPENKYGAKGHNFWTDVSMRQKFIEVWKFVANRYKDTPRIAMYEVLPEPNPAGGSAADVTGFYKEVMRAILSVDSRTPFLLQNSTCRGSLYSGCGILPKDRLHRKSFCIHSAR